MIRSSVILLFSILLLALPDGCARAGVGEYNRLACDPALAGIKDVRCGHVEVPVHRARASGPTLRLQVVILEAVAAPAGAATPVFVLSSQPAMAGGAAIVRQLASHPVRRDRDIVLIDQRGFGLNRASCQAEKAQLFQVFADSISAAPFEDALRGIVRRCLARLSDVGIDRRALTYPAMAADVEAVRRALRVPHIHLWGLGFSARTALEVMRAYPDRVSAVVLDAVQPPGALWMRDWRRNFHRALARVDTICKTERSCAKALGSATGAVTDASAGLVHQPFPFTIAHGPDAEPTRFVLNALGFQFLLHYLPQNRRLLPVLPLVVRSVSERRAETIGQMVSLSWASTSMLRLSTVYSIACADRGFDAADLAADHDAHPTLFAIDHIALCEALGVPAPKARPPVVSDRPTLLVNGAFSNGSPPRYGALVAETLSRSQTLPLADDGDGATVSRPCAQARVRAFFQNPTAPADAPCSIDRQPFVFDVAWMPQILSLARDLEAQPRLVLGGAVGLAVLLVLSAVGWPLQALAERRAGRFDRGRTARFVIGGYAALALVAMAGVAAGLYRTGTETPSLLLFGLPAGYGPVGLLWTAVAVAAVPIAALVGLAWRRRWYRLTGRLIATGVAFAGLALAAVAFGYGFF
ncbi:hypothetical protein CCR85_14630 [Rhodothalassium salexigens]|nr:hypothetical protein [Rhodothalassium salexigens]MBK5920627.1 hypothetical protein [Rhodothalassium salexigens]